MNIVFRVDSSNIIGTGHIYRCLNLAYQYKEHNISFICKNHNYNLNSKISENYKVYELTLNNKENITLDINSWLGESQIEDVKDDQNIESSTLTINNYILTFRKEDGYIDITNLCKAGKKEYKHWNGCCFAKW